MPEGLFALAAVLGALVGRGALFGVGIEAPGRGAGDRVVADHTPVVITRQKAEAVVMVSLADWNAMEETAYLLSTKANAEELLASICELEAGGGTERELIEP